MELNPSYKVTFKYGLVGPSIITATDMDDAVKEAFSLCRFFTACIPDGYGPNDVIETIEPTDIRPGAPGYTCRSTAELPSHEDYAKRYGEKSSFSLAAVERYTV